jgi:hypothetical protein
VVHTYTRRRQARNDAYRMPRTRLESDDLPLSMAENRHHAPSLFFTISLTAAVVKGRGERKGRCHILWPRPAARRSRPAGLPAETAEVAVMAPHLRAPYSKRRSARRVHRPASETTTRTRYVADAWARRPWSCLIRAKARGWPVGQECWHQGTLRCERWAGARE